MKCQGGDYAQGWGDGSSGGLSMRGGRLSMRFYGILFTYLLQPGGNEASTALRFLESDS